MQKGLWEFALQIGPQNGVLLVCRKQEPSARFTFVSFTGSQEAEELQKRPGSRNSSFDYRREEPLHRIPGRMFLNGSSEIASLFTQQGKKGTNQDAMIVWELVAFNGYFRFTDFSLRTDTVFCGVFDGHGPYGHMVAKRVRDSLPLKLSANWEVNITTEDVLKEISLNTAGSMNSEDSNFYLLMKNSGPPLMELRIQPSIDCFCSGTTAVTLVKQGRDIVIGNVGDSRAVLGTRDKDDSLVAIQLTVDLKPNLPVKQRESKCKGRVFALQDEPEVARVWLPNNDSPGLAMARAFGDFCLKDFGLISIWDVLSNKEVVDIIASAPTRSSAARALVESAVRAWRYKYPTSKVDDCAVVCLYLDSDSIISSGAKHQLASIDKVNSGTEKEEVSGGPTGLNHSQTVRNGKGILPEDTGKDNASDEIYSDSGWSGLLWKEFLVLIRC
ncbi:hypothetical protein FNV43_RR04624 [Rhamnella rubrinervis]|uniref:PPM-type phosphatase domain-containing protein n=1 Tax=Rhamnella rubrinervis TaxID=2594499 RepID=A0A8K0MPY4_9ROSA|nr:hypothetical protein FNV43_RR04624 [Rhamnella rubrinervis]